MWSNVYSQFRPSQALAGILHVFQLIVEGSGWAGESAKGSSENPQSVILDWLGRIDAPITLVCKMNNLLVKCFPAKFEKSRTVVPSDLGFLIKGVLELTLVRPRSFLHSYALLFLALF